ncbi:CRISPR-associated protein Cas4 [Longirhabdus pacifica]|uniref:CRISPR-associated protein Cas4 n=1 Tax=Longirhabdus pacifica TaxID=2305227 RepID=UPI001008C129|nr:CRISPR-associated protein Cas4 [Longirhabdus pacifica]
MQHQTIGGVDIQYYVVCKRKLWLYKKGIGMEEESDRVMQGKVLHEIAYPRLLQKEILIDGAFKIDALDGEYVREVKISSKMQKADTMQMLYYLYQLSLRGINKKGLISYTKEKRTEEIVLNDDNRQVVVDAIEGAQNILQLPSPPKAKKVPYCKKCAYYEFCYVLEVDEHDA